MNPVWGLVGSFCYSLSVYLPKTEVESKRPGWWCWPLGGDEVMRVEPPMKGSRVPPALRPLADTGDGMVCELGRGLTRHRVCSVLILNVCPPDPEDSAHGPAVKGARQTPPALLFPVTDFLSVTPPCSWLSPPEWEVRLTSPPRQNPRQEGTPLAWVLYFLTSIGGGRRDPRMAGQRLHVSALRPVAPTSQRRVWS